MTSPDEDPSLYELALWLVLMLAGWSVGGLLFIVPCGGYCG
jgi:hypothetical protein